MQVSWKSVEASRRRSTYKVRKKVTEIRLLELLMIYHELVRGVVFEVLRVKLVIIAY